MLLLLIRGHPAQHCCSTGPAVQAQALLNSNLLEHERWCHAMSLTLLPAGEAWHLGSRWSLCDRRTCYFNEMLGCAVMLQRCPQAPSRSNKPCRMCRVKPVLTLAQAGTHARRQFFRSGKSLPVDRGAGVNQAVVRTAADRVLRGDWLHLFPEGKVRSQQSTAPWRADLELHICKWTGLNAACMLRWVWAHLPWKGCGGQPARHAQCAATLPVVDLVCRSLPVAIGCTFSEGKGPCLRSVASWVHSYTVFVDRAWFTT